MSRAVTLRTRLGRMEGGRGERHAALLLARVRVRLLGLDLADPASAVFVTEALAKVRARIANEGVR